LDYIEYINGIKDKIAVLPEEYCFSFARNYAGLNDDLEIVLLDLFWQWLCEWIANPLS
jgi:hypothetical protein